MRNSNSKAFWWHFRHCQIIMQFILQKFSILIESHELCTPACLSCRNLLVSSSPHLHTALRLTKEIQDKAYHHLVSWGGLIWQIPVVVGCVRSFIHCFEKQTGINVVSAAIWLLFLFYFLFFKKNNSRSFETLQIFRTIEILTPDRYRSRWPLPSQDLSSFVSVSSLEREWKEKQNSI